MVVEQLVASARNANHQFEWPSDHAELKQVSHGVRYEQTSCNNLSDKIGTHVVQTRAWYNPTTQAFCVEMEGFKTSGVIITARESCSCEGTQSRQVEQDVVFAWTTINWTSTSLSLTSVVAFDLFSHQDREIKWICTVQFPARNLLKDGWVRVQDGEPQEPPHSMAPYKLKLWVPDPVSRSLTHETLLAHSQTELQLRLELLRDRSSKFAKAQVDLADHTPALKRVAQLLDASAESNAELDRLIACFFVDHPK